MSQPDKFKCSFRLIRYQCSKCMAVEHVWNSRDGYVPHTIMCGCCGNESTQMEGSNKRFNKLPTYALRVFVDVTQEEANQYAAQQLEYLLAAGPEEAKAELAEDEARQNFLEAQAAVIYGKGNRPHTIFRREYMERKGLLS